MIRIPLLLTLLSISAGAIAQDQSILEAAGPHDSWASTQVTLNGHSYKLYVADNDARRQRGLMHVQYLPPKEGVLFVFDDDQEHCMWMKNTLIPLKVIYIDKAGKYINSIDMIPGDLTPRCAADDARYAIEINSADIWH